jgi:tripartite-type tricarboxylate transporter receptor subunit TctC
VHLSGELFNSLTGIKTVHIAYKGGAEALTDLIAGRVHVMFASMSSALTLIRSGKVKALAVTSGERNAALPELPTVREAAVPGYNVTGFFGFLAPAATPRAIVAKLNDNLVTALKTPETKERLAALGVDVMWSTPEQFGEQIREEIAQWTKAVKAAGAKAD